MKGINKRDTYVYIHVVLSSKINTNRNVARFKNRQSIITLRNHTDNREYMAES